MEFLVGTFEQPQNRIQIHADCYSRWHLKFQLASSPPNPPPHKGNDSNATGPAVGTQLGGGNRLGLGGVGLSPGPSRTGLSAMKLLPKLSAQLNSFKAQSKESEELTTMKGLRLVGERKKKDIEGQAWLVTKVTKVGDNRLK